jgi:hypothetical protein
MGDAILAPSLLPARVAALFEAEGLRVERFAMAELCEKAGGASRCLVSHARLPEGQVRIPDDNRLAAIADPIRAERR